MFIRNISLFIAFCLLPLAGFSQAGHDREIAPGTYKYSAYRRAAWMEKHLSLNKAQSEKATAALLEFFRNVASLPMYADSSLARSQKFRILEDSLNNRLQHLMDASQWAAYRRQTDSLRQKAKQTGMHP